MILERTDGISSQLLVNWKGFTSAEMFTYHLQWPNVDYDNTPIEYYTIIDYWGIGHHYWLRRSWGEAEVNIGILRSISRHVQGLKSQQLFYYIISQITKGKKKKEEKTPWSWTTL